MDQHTKSQRGEHSVAERIVAPTEKTVEVMRNLGLEPWEERIRVCGPCWNRAFDESGEDVCHCNVYEDADPRVVGYPPFHEGCTCVVERV